MWLFRHKYHVDDSLSSPVVKPATIRTVLSLALSHNGPIHQLDVKNAFLNVDLSENLYMYQPPGSKPKISQARPISKSPYAYMLARGMERVLVISCTSNALHNAIMEAGGKDSPPMLASVAEGSSEITTERYMENYKNVSQDIRDQLNAEAATVQIILTGIDNDIYSTINGCSNACEMWKAIERGTGYENQRVVNVAGARENVGTQVVQKSRIQCYNCKEYGHVLRECQKPKRAKDAAYHKEKMLLYTTNNSGPIFDAEPLQKVYNNDDNYNVFDADQEYPEQPESVNEPYADMCFDRDQDDQDDTDELTQERDLLASLIDKLKYEIDDNKNRNKILKSSNQALVDKLKGEIEDFKTKNKSLESLNNHFKEANYELSKTNQFMFNDLKKFQSELDKYHDVNYTSKVEIDYAKAKGDLISYKMESEKSFNEYTRKIIDLNQTVSDLKKELSTHQETITIMSQQKEAQIKFYETHEDKDIDKVIALENKVKVLDNIIYKTGQPVQKINMLNWNYETSFFKPEFLKKAQRANPRLYDIGCYNDNPALMLAS
uniref:Ribonuclease H-like domain-containing protein n=1 Tax=Tanacetum cinerariifolium TaxID=118510 RepID=A0A699H7K6_TANCI|nr:ribonuclease H-like domain-containing protein [Tanacetum cinerariifolium]